MNRTQREPDPRQALHPLLFDACRCGPGGRVRCLACLRWHRHWRMVLQRRRAWRAAW